MTYDISQFVANLKLENVPQEIQIRAHKAFADTIGATIAGSGEKPAKIACLVTGAAAMPVQPDGTQVILGEGRKNIPAADAAMINAMAAHSMEYNDLFFGMPGHPSAILVPVALSVGYLAGASSKEIIEAYIAAFEVLARVNEALMPVHHEKGFHSTSIAGILGGAVTTAKLLRLSEEEICRAISISCTLACGLRRNFGTFANSLHVGNAAANGIRAALFAKNGMTCEEDLLTLKDGYINAFYGSGDKLEKLVNTLGKTWAFDVPGLLIKKYPACFSTYQAIDAALALANGYDISLDGVAAIECLTSEISYMSLPKMWAKDVYDERFCIPYCVAMALYRKQLNKDSFMAEWLNDGRVLSLKEKFTYGVHPELLAKKGFGFTEVNVLMKDGSRYTQRAYPNSDERVENWPPERLHQKFIECTMNILGKEKSEKLYEACRCFSEISDMDSFWGLLY